MFQRRNKMFQKCIMTIGLLFMSLAVSAAEPVKFMYVGIPQVGGGVIFAQSYGKNLQGVDSKFVSLKDCDLAMKEIETSDNVVYLLASTNTITAMKHNIECAPKFKPEDILVTTVTYFDYCQKTGNKLNLFKDRINIGAASIVPMDGMVKDLNAQNSTRWVSVGYPASQLVAAAVLNGDIDLGFLTHSVAAPIIANKQLDCQYTTNPKAPNYMAKSFRQVSSDFEMDYILAVKSKDPKVRKAAIDAVQSAGFQEWLKTSGFDVYKTANFDQKDVDHWNAMNNNTFDNFIK